MGRLWIPQGGSDRRPRAPVDDGTKRVPPGERTPALKPRPRALSGHGLNTARGRPAMESSDEVSAHDEIPVAFPAQERLRRIDQRSGDPADDQGVATETDDGDEHNRHQVDG